MDFYSYYLRRMTTAADKKAGIESCKSMAIQLIDNGPLTWGIESGACFLATLHEVDAGNIDLLPIFEEVEQALTAELQEIRLELEVERKMKTRSTDCGRPKYGKCPNGRGGRK